MIWFTSDWHLGHKNIIKYCNRPFKDVNDMDRALVWEFNKLVKPEDTTYFLGDFCFHKDKQFYINMLNGTKIFLWGNHDKDYLFKSFPTYLEIDSYGMLIGMSHFPARFEKVFGSTDYLDLKLCGHVHEKWKSKNEIINVGVDVWDFKPVSIIHLKKNKEHILNENA